MKSLLSFESDPVPRYHTYPFHRKRADKWMAKADEIPKLFIEQVKKELRDLIEIPEDFRILFIGNYEKFRKLIYNSFPGNNIISPGGDICSRGFTEISELYRHNYLRSVKEKILLELPFISIYDGARLRNSLILSQENLAEMMVHLDYSLSAPNFPKDVFKGQSFSFSITNGFGIDSDMIVWVIKQDLLGKLNLDETSLINNYPTDFYKSLYIFNEVMLDMQRRGIKIINNEIVYKSITLYKALDESKILSTLITEERNRSENIICGSGSLPPDKLKLLFYEKGIILDCYLDKTNRSIIRIGNFPVHSKEQVESLADTITEL